MPLLALDLPPGVWRNGTQYEAKGRFYDSNLVRWYDGELRPWGGWTSFSATAIVAPPVRGMLDWVDSSGLFWMTMGTPTKLYVSDFNGDINDITPSGLSAGRGDASNAAGYGSGNYGANLYGQSTGSSSLTLPATVWTMDTLEQNPVFCNADDGKIYTWDLVTAHIATQCANSPTGCKAVFVTPEGFIMALGANSDPRQVAWPDQSSFTSWTPGPTVQAGFYEIQTSGALMCGTALKQGGLLFCSTDVHLATYIGAPYFYSFTLQGRECGIISQAGYAVAEDIVAWMGVNSFWQYNGAVSAIESDVSDYVFANLNTVQRSKVWALHNAQFGEITWFYPSIASTEIDSYVTWNYREGHWAISSASGSTPLVRTAGILQGVLTNPVMVDASGNIWTHETGFTYTGAGAPYATTGPFEWDQNYTGDTLTGTHDGTMAFDIVELIPDSKTIGDVTVTFYTNFYPLGPQTTYGPYTITDPLGLRVAGRQARMQFSGVSASDWRIGQPRLDFRPGGAR